MPSDLQECLSPTTGSGNFPRPQYHRQSEKVNECDFHEHFIDAHVGVELAALRAPFAAFAVIFEYVYRPSFVTERDDDVG